MNVMLDIETMGHGPDAAIMSIGAVAFDKTGLIPDSDFFVSIPLQSNLDARRTISASTIEWWLGQSDEARESLLHAVGERVTFDEALKQLRNYLNAWCPSSNNSVWANGAMFDFRILRHAYESKKWRDDGVAIVPWTYRQECCMRALRRIEKHHPQIMPWTTVCAEANVVDAVAHHPTVDAKLQALYVCQWLGRLPLTSGIIAESVVLS